MTNQPTTPETQAVETKELRLPIMEKDLPPIIRPIVRNAPACRKVPSFIACLAPPVRPCHPCEAEVPL